MSVLVVVIHLILQAAVLNNAWLIDGFIKLYKLFYLTMYF